MLGWAAAIAGGFILGALVRPSGLVEVVVWFALAGAVVVFAAADRIGAWALLVPAIYLPVHLLIGIGRAILRNGGVRTDPPPTAAIVPLAMLLAAAAAGALAAALSVAAGDRGASYATKSKTRTVRASLGWPG